MSKVTYFEPAEQRARLPGSLLPYSVPKEEAGWREDKVPLQDGCSKKEWREEGGAICGRWVVALHGARVS